MSVEVHLKRLSPRKFFPTHFTNKLAFVSMSFGVAVAISDAGKSLTANRTLEEVHKLSNIYNPFSSSWQLPGKVFLWYEFFDVQSCGSF